MGLMAFWNFQINFFFFFFFITTFNVYYIISSYEKSSEVLYIIESYTEQTEQTRRTASRFFAHSKTSESNYKACKSPTKATKTSQEKKQVINSLHSFLSTYSPAQYLQTLVEKVHYAEKVYNYIHTHRSIDERHK